MILVVMVFQVFTVLLEIDRLEKELAPWTAADAHGKIRAGAGPNSFSVKLVFTATPHHCSPLS